MMDSWQHSDYTICDNCGANYVDNGDGCPTTNCGKTNYTDLGGLSEDIMWMAQLVEHETIIVTSPSIRTFDEETHVHIIGFGHDVILQKGTYNIKKDGIKVISVPPKTSGQATVKKSRARSKKQVYKGIEFDSKNEVKRYIYLEKLELAGIISNLKAHPASYQLHPRLEAPKNRLRRKFEKDKGVYTPDFSYNWQEFYIVEDTKVHDSKVLKEDNRFVPHVDTAATLRHNIYRNTIVYTMPNQEFFLTAFDKRSGLWRYFFNGKKELIDFSLE